MCPMVGTHWLNRVWTQLGSSDALPLGQSWLLSEGDRVSCMGTSCTEEAQASETCQSKLNTKGFLCPQKTQS